jgi:two-component system OmpR family sensor kinase
MFYLEFILYAAFFFIGIVALLGSRLAFALVQQNEMLLREADQRRQLQTELSAALAEESAARREQRHFLDMVSHEFRTPLAIMDRAAEMIALTLSDKPEAANELAEVTAMRAEGQRLRLMIDAFLAQERLQSGLGEPRRENFDVAALLEELRDSLDMDLQHRLHLLMPVNCPANGDPDLSRIAIASLLDVALNEPGSAGAITLRLERRDSHAQISFEGTAPGIGSSAGIGMAAENDGDEPEALGLITARRLFEAQGGTLLLAPDAGPGRLAVARLPQAVAAVAK